MSPKKNIHPLNKRFMEVAKELGYSGASLAQMLDMTEASISYVRNGKHLPSTGALLGLLEKHQDVNPDWLLMGIGTMLKKGAMRHGIASIPSDLHKEITEIKQLLKLSIEAQVERNILTDEVLSIGENRMDQLERQLKDLRKGGGGKG